MTGPYATAARQYLAAGWSPLPLPPRKKKEPPRGWTGRAAQKASGPDVEEWCAAWPNGNIALWLPPGVIGIDVDAHKGPAELAAWRGLEERYGSLPELAPWCSSRDDGISGIRLLAVPGDYAAVTDLGPAGEVIQHFHRYVVAPPSIHPDTGQPYRWINAPDDHIVPDVARLPPLPPAWLDGLRAGKTRDGFQQPGKSGWTDPDVDHLLEHGCTADTTQDEQLRDVVWKLHGRGWSKPEIRVVWNAIVSRTTLTDPARPWTGQDFERHWGGAHSKQGNLRLSVPAGRHAAPSSGQEILAEVSLAALIRDGVPPPEFLCKDMLYLGGQHVIAGPPDSGKTTLALWWVLQLARDRRPVVFLDEEGGQEITAEKLIALGAQPADAEHIHYIPFPSRGWNLADQAALFDRLAQLRPALVMWDSAAAFLARAGLDENDAGEVTRFWNNVLIPCARVHGAAVLVVDHDTKDGSASRYSRGSGAKLAACDVMFKVSIVKPFSRLQSGVLKLHVSKDRRGWLHRDFEITVRTQGGFEFEFTDTYPASGEPDGLKPAERKLLEALTADPSTRRQIVDRIDAKHGHGLTDKTVRSGLRALLDAGLADHIPAEPGRQDFWLLTDPGTPEIT